MTSEQLKTFLLVVETKSFSRAAKALFISQSSVSKRIYELEKELGQTLLYRNRAGIYLTSYGKTMKSYAEQIINIEDKVFEQMRQTSKHISHLTIGTLYAYYDMYLSRKIKLFSEMCPNTAITIRFGHSASLLNELMKASIDVAFTHRPIDYSDYICRAIGQDSIVLVTDSQNTEYQETIDFNDIKELPMIDTNFLLAPTRQKLFPQPYQSQISVDVLPYVIPLLKGSHFFALLPFNLVQEQLKTGVFREIKVLGDTIPPINYFLIYNKNLKEEVSIQNFMNHLFAE